MSNFNMIKTKLILVYLLLQITIFISTAQAVEISDKVSNDFIPHHKTKSYSDRFKIQIGSYYVKETNTEVSINSDIGGIGTTIDMKRDLGTDDQLTIPRIDGYYRFNDKHRIDFSWFQVARKGRKTIDIEILINGTTYAANSIVDSKIKTNFYKLAYAYSFYRSPKVELSFSAGLNILEYSLTIDNLSSGQKEAADVIAPLPVFGLRMDYALTPKWLIHYRFETFYIELSDEFRGSLIDSELGVEYRLLHNIGVGIGFTNFIVDAKVKSSSYTGGLNDLYRGVNVYASAYF